MCGITGLYAKHGLPDAAHVHAMTERLTHRGPIEDGYYSAAPVMLGMRRLSIIDIGGGHQPVYNEDRSLAVILNGEIFNYVELADELESRGHRFYTRSDTEVIVHLYEDMGPDCVERLNGMFAFALWDTRRQQLFLARDRLGVKPLYYADSADGFAFASELKSLLLCPFVSRDIDGDAMADYLTLMYIRAPHTPFKDVAKLPPGHFMLVGRDGVRVQRWWDLSEHCRPSTLSLAQAAERVREVLADAVRIRLRSDVPVGAFLSGGLDSSAVTAFAAQQLDQPLNTYAVGFAGDGFDELGYADIVAQAFKTNHHPTTVTVDDALEHLPLLTWHLDEPHGDSAVVPTYLVSKVAAQQQRVILSGLGGDELFGGYDRYFDGQRAGHLYRRIPAWLRAAIVAPLAQLLGPSIGDRLQANNLPDAERYLRALSMFLPAQRAVLLASGNHRSGSLAGEFNAYPGHDRVNRMMFVDTLTYLPDDVLHITDRMSMAVSLEARTPFLDYRLVELAAGLPGRYKVDQLRRLWKICLKEAMASVLPAPILTRPKWGFGAPVTAWMQRGLTDRVRALFRDSSAVRHGLVHQAGVQPHLSAVRAGDFLHAQRQWMLLMLELWARVFLDGHGERPVFTLGEASA